MRWWIIFGMCFLICQYVIANNKTIPVVVVTDLYHPYQDPGDNIDLINGYFLPNVELKAILLDCHASFRKDVSKGAGSGTFVDKAGPREPGIISVQQLNYIFKKSVPFGIGPFSKLTTLDDKMENISGFEQSAVDLLYEVLLNSSEKVNVLSFGSQRILAVAYNRFPKLMKKKIKMIHVSAGTSNNNLDFLEWNVGLDVKAFVRLIRSDLPIALYPCAAGKLLLEDKDKFNAFAKDDGNTYFEMKNLSYFSRFDSRIQQYIKYVFERRNTIDYLSILEIPHVNDNAMFDRNLHMWEFPLWMQLLDLNLVRQRDGQYALKFSMDLLKSDYVIEQKLVPAKLNVLDSGHFESIITNSSSNKYIYIRSETNEFEIGMNEALPLFLEKYLREIN
ncbi:hypothetical protein [Sphingobacterium bovistauri]|uniref:Inosine-uridine preferring nucleoside hydrolase n=1 Tax=Sphingobacterium bovistauri TaxID=2781959 RepID=A0ABS7Z7V3_9SPHI|nr:hypothetical protein [Sphingobacterium bovistauri]MCA5006271.1 hypothetical protein [Sphingobacterium bovistauri]